MTVRSMRQIDRLIGVPFCWTLGIALAFLPTRSRQVPAASVRNILVIKFFGMGSILLSTPALRLMKQAFPGARVSYLSFSNHRELLERIPLVDRVFTIDTASARAFVRDLFYFLSETRRMQFDVTFDFEFFSKFSTLLSGLSGAGRRIGFELPTRWRSMILTHQVKLSKEKHVLEAFCDQIRIVGYCGNAPEVQTPVTFPADARRLDERLPLNGWPMICVNVNAGDTFLERRWMPDRFASLIGSLQLSRPETVFIFIGLGSERSYVQEVIDQIPGAERCLNFAGLLSLGELTELLSRCELCISNDSGPLHLAVALGKPCVALYGPETPQFYGPVAGPVSTVYKGVSCSPCMNIYDAKSFRCPHHARCMRAIEVADVQEAVESLHVPA